MDGNKIANITNATFVGLKSLKSISLQDNLLSSLQENLFVFLSKVSQLKNDFFKFRAVYHLHFRIQNSYYNKL